MDRNLIFLWEEEGRGIWRVKDKGMSEFSPRLMIRDVITRKLEVTEGGALLSSRKRRAHRTSTGLRVQAKEVACGCPCVRDRAESKRSRDDWTTSEETDINVIDGEIWL